MRVPNRMPSKKITNHHAEVLSIDDIGIRIQISRELHKRIVLRKLEEDRPMREILLEVIEKEFK